MDRDEEMILNLLKAISDEPDTTQKDLATRLGVAVGLVNSYLKRVIYKGYVKTKQLERRRLRYLLTPSGIKEKARLTYEFLEYSFQYIREVRRKANEAMRPFAAQNKKRVIFYGSGEVAELAYLAVRELRMELVGIVDPKNEGKRCVDHSIYNLDWLRKNGSADLLLSLASHTDKNDELAQVEEIAKEKQISFVSCF